MNAWKSIILAGALFALAAPVASASLDRTLPTKASHAKVAKAVVQRRIVAKQIVAKTHKPIARAVVTQPLYIYSAGPSVPAGTDTSVVSVEDDCGADVATESQTSSG